MKKWVVLIIAIAALVGCSGQNTPSPQKTATQATVKKSVLSVQAPDATDAQKQQISNALESLNEACPLLSSWTLDIESATAKIEKFDKNMMDGEYHARGWKDYVEVKVVVKNPVSVIPRDFYASGHHCTFRIGGKAVHTAKQPCAKICKGSGVDAPGKIWFWIKQ